MNRDILQLKGHPSPDTQIPLEILLCLFSLSLATLLSSFGRSSQKRASLTSSRTRNGSGAVPRYLPGKNLSTQCIDLGMGIRGEE